MKKKISTILAALLMSGCMLMSVSKISAQEVETDAKLRDIALDFSIESTIRRVGMDRTPNSNSYYRIGDDRKQYMILDHKGALLSLNLLSNLSAEELENKTLIEETEIEKTEQYISRKYVPEEYRLSEKSTNGEVTFFTYTKSIEGDIINPYDFVRLCIDNETGKVIYYTKKSEFVYEGDSKYLSQEMMVQQVKAQLKKPISVENCDLRIKRYEDAYRLVYRLEVDGGLRYEVDAYTGEIIVEDYLLGDGAVAHVPSGIMEDIYLRESAGYHERILKTLGYNVKRMDTSSRSKLLSFLNGADSYAFCFNGHGSPRELMMERDLKHETVLRTDDISGYWRFVFLNACSTAKTDEWANAFGIYRGNNKKRVFIGWSRDVWASDARDFSKYFAEVIERRPYSSILSNVYQAIADIPTDKLYYVLLIGDKNTAGLSHE